MGFGGGGRRGGIRSDGDAGLTDIFETEGDFLFAACEVKGDVMVDELLLEAFEVEISAISQQFRSVDFVSDIERVATQEM
jgi:hypothetical protein